MPTRTAPVYQMDPTRPSSRRNKRTKRRRGGPAQGMGMTRRRGGTRYTLPYERGRQAQSAGRSTGAQRRRRPRSRTQPVSRRNRSIGYGNTTRKAAGLESYR